MNDSAPEIARYTAGASENPVLDTSHAATSGVVPPSKATPKLYEMERTVQRTRHGASSAIVEASTPAAADTSSERTTCPTKTAIHWPPVIHAMSGYETTMSTPVITATTARRPNRSLNPPATRTAPRDNAIAIVLISNPVFAETPATCFSHVAEYTKVV